MAPTDASTDKQPDVLVGISNPITLQSVKTEFVLSVIRQGPAALLLCFFLYAGWRFGDYIIREGIPAHLAQIQSGYESIKKGYADDIRRITEAIEKKNATDEQTKNELTGAIRELRMVVFELRSNHASQSKTPDLP